MKKDDGAFPGGPEFTIGDIASVKVAGPRQRVNIYRIRGNYWVEKLPPRGEVEAKKDNKPIRD